MTEFVIRAQMWVRWMEHDEKTKNKFYIKTENIESDVKEIVNFIYKLYYENQIYQDAFCWDIDVCKQPIGCTCSTDGLCTNDKYLYGCESRTHRCVYHNVQSGKILDY